MRRLALLSLLGLALASSGPKYEDWTKYLLSAPDYRLEQVLKGRWPYVEVLRKDRWREYQRGSCDPQKDPQGCQGRLPWNEAQAHEFRLPLSSLEATQEVAKDLRRAWQRFEERYYWRVITELNNPAFWFAYCAVGLKGPDLDPPLPPFRLNIPSEAVDTAFLGKLTPFNPGGMASAGLHGLDRYLPVPQIPRDDFCDDLGMGLLPIMYIPGFKALIQGTEIFRTPGYPSKPLWFNEAEANARVERAMKRAMERYYPEYLREVAEILLKPRPSDPASFLGSLGLTDYRNLGAPKVYLPVPWQGHLLNGGAVVAPVYTELVPRDPQVLWNQVQTLWDTYRRLIDRTGSELEKVYLYVHFYRSVRTLFDSKAFYGIPGIADTLKQGVIRLVEAPLRTLTQGIPVLKGCTGSMDDLAGCAARALMTVDGAVRMGNDLTGLTGGSPQNEPIKGTKESPGLWKFEEAKRWFPPASLPVHEAFGYTTFFQAMNLLEVTNIPDMRNVDLSQVNLSNWASFAWGQLSRLIVYWHVPITIDVRVEYCPPCVLAYPSLPLEGPAQPLGVPPYTLPFVGERAHWRWVSVPEGYEVPGVKGSPYKVLGDLGGIGPDLSLLYRPLIGR